MIIYLHGFSSAPSSHKATALKEHLAVGDFEIPFYPFESPDAAVAALTDFIHARSDECSEPVVLMGSSLGGFYAQYLAATLDVVDALIMINPALAPRFTLTPHTGAHINLVSGEPFVFSELDLLALDKYEVPAVIKKPVLLLLDEGDEIIDSRIAASRYATTGDVLSCPRGNHRFTHLDEAMPRIRAFYFQLGQ